MAHTGSNLCAPCTLGGATWEDAQVGPSENQVLQLGGAVCDKEAAGAGGTDIRHR
jgi:hypothetical protein